jgi:hypothetical protein
MSVAFVTFCHPPRYAEKLHRPGVLRAMVRSHGWDFNDVLVVHNQCRAADYPAFDYACRTADLPRGAFDPLLARYGVEPDNPVAEEMTHGEGAAHWWKVHVVNHLFGLERTDSDHVVFADCDTWIKGQPSSWVGVGLAILANRPDVLIVSPGDGAQHGGPGEGGQWPDGTRLTRNVSQQLFLCRADEFRGEVDFDVPWNGRFDAPGGPFAEYYWLLEGRLNRYMGQSGQWRAVLPDAWRYWHDSYWERD